MPKTPFLWTNDDVWYGATDQLQRALDFLDRFNLKGTFFVVPCIHNSNYRPLTDDTRVVELLKQAMRAGHEAQQHTTTHHCEENGTADLRMYDLMGVDSKKFHGTHRFMLERIWELDALVAQIGWGRQVWIDAFGAGSPGYRPGCGAFCRNMYIALRQLGFQWVSSRLVSLTGWQWASNHWDYPITWEGPGHPSLVEGLVEIPLFDDIAFFIPPGKVNTMVELGWAHWQKCVEMGWPFTLVSHPKMLEHEGGTGYDIHAQLIPRILDSGNAVPMTVHQYHQRFRQGEFQLATESDSYGAPIQLPPWHALARKPKTAPIVAD